MRVLLTDFVRRWWWAFVLALLSMICQTFMWMLLFAGAIAPAMVARDIKQGALRIHRILPVALPDLGKTMWIEAVLLLPGIMAVIQAVATSILIVLGVGEWNYFLIILVVFVLNSAFAACCVLLMVPSCLEKLKRGVPKSSTWNTSWPPFPLAFCLGFSLHHGGCTDVSDIAVRFPFLLPAAACLLLFSYLDAPRLPLPRLAVRCAVRKRLDTFPSLSANGPARLYFGFPGVWLLQAQPAALAAGISLPLLYLIFRHMSEAQHAAVVLCLLATFAIAAAFVRMSQWNDAIRVLRALPLSRTRLALYFMSIPCVSLTTGVVIIAPFILLLTNAPVQPGTWLVFGGILIGVAMPLSVLSLRFDPLSPAAGVALGSFFVVGLLLFGAIYESSRMLRPFPGVTLSHAMGLVALLVLLFLAAISFGALRVLLARSTAIYRDRSLAAASFLGED